MKQVFLSLLVVTVTAFATDPVPVIQPALSQLAGSFQGGYLGCIISVELKEGGDYHARWNGCLGEYGAANGTWTIAGTEVTLNPISESGAMQGHLHLLHIIKDKGDFAFVPDRNDKTCFSSGLDGDTALHRRKPVKSSTRTRNVHR